MTYVDRKSRRLLASISEDMSSRSVYEATLKAFGGEQPRSIILDNGSEFALFKDMERELYTTVYFADPSFSVAAPSQREHQRRAAFLLP